MALRGWGRAGPSCAPHLRHSAVRHASAAVSPTASLLPGDSHIPPYAFLRKLRTPEGGAQAAVQSQHMQLSEERFSYSSRDVEQTGAKAADTEEPPEVVLQSPDRVYANPVVAFIQDRLEGDPRYLQKVRSFFVVAKVSLYMFGWFIF